jgi:hypothetical protein
MKTHRRHKLTPRVEGMEDRVVLSHAGPTFINGAAVLTSRAYSRALSDVGNAFTRFAQHGHGTNYSRLGASLNKAIAPIPYHRADGLLDALRSEVQSMQQGIQGGVPGSVRQAMQFSQQDVQSFVQSEIAAGRIVMPR